MLGAYPPPLRLTEVPTDPELGVRASVAVVVVKVAIAVSAGTVPTSLPDTVTVCAPTATLGKVKVQENVPVADVVCEVQVCVEIVPPAMMRVPMTTLIE